MVLPRHPHLDYCHRGILLRGGGGNSYRGIVVASTVATLGPVSLGLDTFEASSVALLKAIGVPIEAGLTATLLLRGFTLWLPMLPSLWLARQELR